MNWEDLKYWQSGEWQVVSERLADLTAAGKIFNPRDKFRSLDLCPYGTVKVVLLGQDPYPRHDLADGLAFSSAGGDTPPSLSTILKEYASDMGYPMPKTGRLDTWAKRGVLLWNVYPTCEMGQSLSHAWPEWEQLTKEVLETLATEPYVLFVAFGSVAQRMCKKYLSTAYTDVMYLSHPSPRGQSRGQWPVAGTRLFSTINAKLAAHRVSPIDWRLP